MLGKPWLNNEFQQIYLLKYNGLISGLKMIDGEVEELKFIPLKKLETDIASEETLKHYVRHPKEYFDFVIKAIKKELKK